MQGNTNRYILKKTVSKKTDNSDTDSKPAEPEIIANPQCRVLIVF
jgi:hypothetical protein